MTRDEWDALPNGTYVRLVIRSDSALPERIDTFYTNCRHLIKVYSEVTHDYILAGIGYENDARHAAVLESELEFLHVVPDLEGFKLQAIFTLAQERDDLAKDRRELRAALEAAKTELQARSTQLVFAKRSLAFARSRLATLQDKLCVLLSRSGEALDDAKKLAEELRETD